MKKNIQKNFVPSTMRSKLSHSLFGYILIAMKSYRYSMKNLDSYSQFGEDLLLFKYLPEDKGFYLDVGSGDPVRGSNTFFLYQRNWTGILIDPLSRNIFASKLIRRRDKIIQALVGSADKKYTFYELFPYEYSTSDYSRVYDLIRNNDARLIKQVELDTLSISKLKLKIDLNSPSFLNVDCEGNDLEVLRTINLEVVNFRVICVEDFDFKQGPELSEIGNFLSNMGYRLMEQAGPSSIYVNIEWLEKSKVNKK